MDKTSNYNQAMHDMGRSRRPRGWLSIDVKRIVDYYVEGDLVLAPDQLLTPYRIMQAFKNIEAVEDLPSCGSISDVLKRWRSWGFAVIEDNPLRFVEYTELGKSLGLQGCEDKYKEYKKSLQSPN